VLDRAEAADDVSAIAKVESSIFSDALACLVIIAFVPAGGAFHTSSIIICSSGVAKSTPAVAFLLNFSRSFLQKCLLPLPLSSLFELYSKAGKLQKSFMRTLHITVTRHTPPSLPGCITSTSTSFA
jgi:hypothetical protein